MPDTVVQIISPYVIERRQRHAMLANGATTAIMENIVCHGTPPADFVRFSYVMGMHVQVPGPNGQPMPQFLQVEIPLPKATSLQEVVESVPEHSKSPEAVEHGNRAVKEFFKNLADQAKQQQSSLVIPDKSVMKNLRKRM